MNRPGNFFYKPRATECVLESDQIATYLSRSELHDYLGVGNFTNVFSESYCNKCFISELNK